MSREKGKEGEGEKVEGLFDGKSCRQGFFYTLPFLVLACVRGRDYVRGRERSRTTVCEEGEGTSCVQNGVSSLLEPRFTSDRFPSQPSFVQAFS